MLGAPADLPLPQQFHMKTSFFYLASNGIWKWAAATYLGVRPALREPFVPSGGGEREVKPSAAAQRAGTTPGLFSGSSGPASPASGPSCGDVSSGFGDAARPRL